MNILPVYSQFVSQDSLEQEILKGEAVAIKTFSPQGMVQAGHQKSLVKPKTLKKDEVAA